MASEKSLSYVPLSSAINPSFFSKLSQLKLEVLKSEEKFVPIWGYTKLINDLNLPVNLIEVDSTSFNLHFLEHETHIPFYGNVQNVNTIEKFKNCDKQLLVDLEGAKFHEKLMNGDILKNPSLINWFHLLTYADLKKYQLYYWFAFPVLQNIVLRIARTCNITEEFSDNLVNDLYNEFKKLDSNQKPYFAVVKLQNFVQVNSLYETCNDWSFFKERELYFAFINFAPADNVGSNLRLYAACLVHFHPDLGNTEVNFIALNLGRNKDGVTLKSSTVYKLKLPDNASIDWSRWLGWEKNEKKNMGPRFVNLKKSIDPEEIMELSTDLNLKLMKWNMVPNLNLNKIKAAKCLLLGAGTLGCAVARSLLGWGVRHMTFVDYGVVNSSNPVRQSLFTFQDVLDSKPKAQAAADCLKSIHPGVVTKGYQMSIPMPGHLVNGEDIQEAIESVEKLDKLIDTHDVIFLLLDSREGRWLPTVLGARKQKIVINAALGFDSYLIMRHGIHVENATTPQAHNTSSRDLKSISGVNLGCYFCNDVVAPGNSTKDRTLDQQCTVTRPGVSQIAGAYAAELAVSLLVHDKGVAAPAYYSSKNNELDVDETEPSVLGLVPHSIRGFISSFEQFCPATEKFTNCTACSQFVMKNLFLNGTQFLLSIFNDSKQLERISEVPKYCDSIDNEAILDEEFSDWEIK
ncbi:unnamed protein product [Phyllotreta striolata]|uniref:Ubiquitin-like modifier-activating enzyme ATG7 n=1 Tax=Phyllotreta striolata TaxID=444603 RepID=A0A9N9TXM5_PHYSR|nr:unnamed protein product [Phyllotreta striolata]